MMAVPLAVDFSFRCFKGSDSGDLGLSPDHSARDGDIDDGRWER
jgi:hypothetical protein